jgi:aspartate/methionine/tyrosine aminotransferase
MFSRRLPWPYSPNRLSRLLEEKRDRGAAVLDLTESNPTRVGLSYPSESIAAALADPGVALYEPSPRGLETARAAVAANHAARGRPVDPGRIVLTASTSEAYAILFKLLGDPGDAILAPRPSYPLFDYLAALEGLRVAPYTLVHDDHWSIDFTSLERAFDASGAPPRAVVLVNPNNPTGSALRRGERERLREICGRRGAALIADEVFFDFLDAEAVERGARSGDPIVSALAPGQGSGPLTFILGGLSKSCGMPQMKLGWIVVDGPAVTAGEALERIDLIADTYLSVGTPVMRAAGRLLEIGAGIRSAITRRIEANLRILKQRNGAGSPCRVLDRDGGWQAVLQVPAIVPEEDLVLTLLAEDDVLVHPGYFFDFSREAYLVLSLLPEPAIFEEALRRILVRTQRS